MGGGCKTGIKRMKIAVIIVTYNNQNTIAKCLDSLSMQDNTLLSSVLVIDNNSSDKTTQIVHQKLLQFKDSSLVKNKLNIGFAKACNQGFELVKDTSADLILLLNPDAYLKPSAFKKAVAEYKQNNKLSAFNPVILYPDGRIWWIGNRLTPLKILLSSFTDFKIAKHEKKGEIYSQEHQSIINSIQDESLLTGCVLFLNNSLIKNGLRFDESFFMYAEDLDLSMQIKKIGFEIKTTPNIIAYHFAESELIKGKLSVLSINSLLKIYRYISSSFKFISKNYGLLAAIIWLLKLPASMLFSLFSFGSSDTSR